MPLSHSSGLKEKVNSTWNMVELWPRYLSGTIQRQVDGWIYSKRGPLKIESAETAGSSEPHTGNTSQSKGPRRNSEVWHWYTGGSRDHDHESFHILGGQPGKAFDKLNPRSRAGKHPGKLVKSRTFFLSFPKSRKMPLCLFKYKIVLRPKVAENPPCI